MPLIFGPLVDGRRGTLGVGTANPWKLSAMDCEEETKHCQNSLPQEADMVQETAGMRLETVRSVL